MNPVAFAWRSQTRQPARTLLGIAGIAAVGALLFDMLLLSRGLVLSFGDVLEDMGFDVRVTATQALPGSGPPLSGASELTRIVRDLPEVDSAVPVFFAGALLTPPDGTPCDVFVQACNPDDGASWRLVEGRDLDPQSDPDPPELVINESLAEALGLGPGDEVDLFAARGFASVVPAARFRIVGIGRFFWDDRTTFTVATTLPAFFRARGEATRDDTDLLMVRSVPGGSSDSTVRAIQDRLPDVRVFTNEELLARFQRTNFSYFRQISFVLTTVTLFFAFLLVTTLLTVSVNQRFAEIAALRALGFSRRRVVADLFCESALLVGAGMLLSLPLGALVARWLDAILKDMPGIPEQVHFFVFEPRALVLHLTLLTGAGVLAALYPVFLAVRLPITATLRKETVS